MAKHNETGRKGEQEAEKYLMAQGYEVLYRNWRGERKEIDLIAFQDPMLVFAEVKTRRGYGFGYPEEAVNNRKQRMLQAAADLFLEAHPQYRQCRFDIISVLLRQDGSSSIMHLEDVFL
jgi:putative endonuclease